MMLSKPNSPDRPTVYTSGVDLWIAVLLIMSPIFAAGLGLYAWTEGEKDGAVILLITAVATCVFTLALTLPCRYTIEDEDLHVRCGILSYRIPLKTIERVEPSRTLASGPALSLKRVKVFTKFKNYVLSPRDQEEFIADLTSASAAKRGSDSPA